MLNTALVYYVSCRCLNIAPEGKKEGVTGVLQTVLQMDYSGAAAKQQRGDMMTLWHFSVGQKQMGKRFMPATSRHQPGFCSEPHRSNGFVKTTDVNFKGRKRHTTRRLLLSGTDATNLIQAGLIWIIYGQNIS